MLSRLTMLLVSAGLVTSSIWLRQLQFWVSRNEREKSLLRDKSITIRVFFLVRWRYVTTRATMEVVFFFWLDLFQNDGAP